MLRALKGNAMLKLTTIEKAKLTKAWDDAEKKVKAELKSNKAMDGRTKNQLKRLMRMSPMLALTVMRKIRSGRDLSAALALTVG